MTAPVNCDFEVIVVGGGTAGMTAARDIARGGKRVALVEQHRTGGECLFTGCVPTKTFVATAKMLHRIKHASELAIDVPEPHLDFARLKHRKNAVIAAIGDIDTPAALEADGIAVLSGTARFVGPFALEIAQQPYTAQQFVLATGSHPAIPPIPGLETAGYLTHESILDLPDIPARLAVIGAGATGLELGQAFARFGARVTIIERSAAILPGVDKESAQILLAQFQTEGIDVITHATIERVRNTTHGKQIMVVRQGNQLPDVEVDEILVATGRIPASGNLELELAGVHCDRSRIIVDSQLRTTASHIWACGDIIGPPYSTHVADDQARTVAANVLGSHDSWNSRAIPSTIFTDPEIATVGIHEDEARAKFGGNLEVLRLPFGDIDRAVTDGRDSGSIKVLLVPGWNRGLLGGEIVGAQVAGEHAGEIVQQFAFLMRWRLPVGLLAKTVQSYPTYSLGARQVVGKHWLDPQAAWGQESVQTRMHGWLSSKLGRTSQDTD